MLAEAHAPALQLISIPGRRVGTFVTKPLHFLLVPALRGSGRGLPDEAVGGGEDPVLMNEGSPTGVEEGGLWTALGPDLQ